MAKTKISNPKTDNYDGEFREFSEDQTSSRVIEVEGRTFHAVQENPFNLWRIVPDSGGPLPKDLGGRYTSVLMAEQAIVKYLNKKTGVSLSA